MAGTASCAWAAQGYAAGACPFCHGKRDFAVQGQGHLRSECGIAGNAIDFVVRAELLDNRIGCTVGQGKGL